MSLTPDDADGIRRGVKAAVVVPILKSRRRKASSTAPVRPDHGRTSAAQLEEACGLARSIDLELMVSQVVDVATPKPATLLGTGKVEELAQWVEEYELEVVIIDHPLTPVQQRNLERAIKAKVLDRTGLILEIFGRRAQTKEGVLQVELAHLMYQRGRLVRSWTHLERQRGGAGFLGGPGETQIETDRRLLQDKIDRLKRDLEKVRQTRALHRENREAVPHPVIALVGYTNAGKSTLFNRMTGASVMAEDLLFATLDPTLRKLTLPFGTRAILSDTVGFIANLPTHLIAAFRATLEEVRQASLILHVRDIAGPDSDAQAADVLSILDDLGVLTGEEAVPIIEVWNKIDLLEAGSVPVAKSSDYADPIETVPVSAITGEGIKDLLSIIEAHLSGAVEDHRITLMPQAMSALDQIHKLALVKNSRSLDDGAMVIDIRTSQNSLERLLRLSGVGLAPPKAK